MKNTHFTLIWTLAKTDLKMRYMGSVLGVLWVFLKPFCIFAVLNFVFSQLFAAQVENYSLSLLTGIILWSFFAEGTMQGMMSFTSKSHILKKIAVPKWAVIMASVLNSFVAFLINLVILGAFYIGYNAVPEWPSFIMLSYMIFLLVLLVWGISMCTAALYVRFRDLLQIWEVMLQVLFYSAPIIYPITILPQWGEELLFLNPLTFLIETVKMVMLEHTTFSLFHHGLYLVGIVGFFLCSWSVLYFTSQRLIEEL